jgi:hypothetical protein
LNGGDSVITFKILTTSTADGDEGVFSATSSTFGSVEGIRSGFRFLEIVAFGSGAIFASSGPFHLLLRTGQLAYLGC